jgi:hypothetical protein
MPLDGVGTGRRLFTGGAPSRFTAAGSRTAPSATTLLDLGEA